VLNDLAEAMKALDGKKLTLYHLPIQKIWKVGVHMNLVCQNADQRDQIWSAVSLNWVMDFLEQKPLAS